MAAVRFINLPIFPGIFFLGRDRRIAGSVFTQAYVELPVIRPTREASHQHRGPRIDALYSLTCTEGVDHSKGSPRDRLESSS